MFDQSPNTESFSKCRGAEYAIYFFVICYCLCNAAQNVFSVNEFVASEKNIKKDAADILTTLTYFFGLFLAVSSIKSYANYTGRLFNFLLSKCGYDVNHENDKVESNRYIAFSAAIASSMKTASSSISLYKLTECHIGEITALATVSVTGVGNFFSILSFLLNTEEQLLADYSECGLWWLKAFCSFLSAGYSVSNAALYLKTMIDFLVKQGLDPDTRDIAIGFSCAATLFVIASNFRSNFHLTRALLDGVVSKCYQENTRLLTAASSDSSCRVTLKDMFYHLSGSLGAILKTIACQASFYALVERYSGSASLAFICMGMTLFGNLFTQFAFLTKRFAAETQHGTGAAAPVILDNSSVVQQGSYYYSHT